MIASSVPSGLADLSSTPVESKSRSVVLRVGSSLPVAAVATTEALSVAPASATNLNRSRSSVPKPPSPIFAEREALPVPDTPVSARAVAMVSLDSNAPKMSFSSVNSSDQLLSCPLLSAEKSRISSVQRPSADLPSKVLSPLVGRRLPE